MKRILLTVVMMVAVLSAGAFAQKRGLSPKQLKDQGWTCFNVPGLGVHCAAPGVEWPPTAPAFQLLYFFNTTDPDSDAADFTGTETLIADEYYQGQPCPTQPGGFVFLGDLGGGVEYWACHRR